MDNNELIELQKETLETVKEYLGNLIPGMNNVITELREDFKDDTWEYLRMILDGFNWVIEAYNGTADYINKDAVVVDAKEFDAAVLELSNSYKARDKEGIAACLSDKIIPTLEKIKEVI